MQLRRDGPGNPRVVTMNLEQSGGGDSRESHQRSSAVAAGVPEALAACAGPYRSLPGAGVVAWGVTGACTVKPEGTPPGGVWASGGWGRARESPSPRAGLSCTWYK